MVRKTEEIGAVIGWDSDSVTVAIGDAEIDYARTDLASLGMSFEEFIAQETAGDPGIRYGEYADAEDEPVGAAAAGGHIPNIPSYGGYPKNLRFLRNPKNSYIAIEAIPKIPNTMLHFTE